MTNLHMYLFINLVMRSAPNHKHVIIDGPYLGASHIYIKYLDKYFRYKIRELSGILLIIDRSY